MQIGGEMMRYPCLVYWRHCKTPVHVCLTQEGISEDGEPIQAFEADLLCNYQDSAKTVLTGDKKLIQLFGTAFFPGDICPELPAISGGHVTVHGVCRDILQGKKARNPDGTVNYTELMLI